MIHVLRLLRLPNLLIIGLGMSICFWYLRDFYSLNPTPMWMVFSLIAGVILCAAAGYTHNDILDVTTDQVNHPEGVVIGNHITEVFAKRLAWVMGILGILLSVIPLIHANLWIATCLVICCALLVPFYNRWLKSSVFIGNIVVALLSLGSLLIPAVVVWERGDLSMHPFVASREGWTFLSLLTFSFLVSLYREIWKDLQDSEGDEKAGIQTAVQALGELPVRNIASCIGFLILIALIGLIYLEQITTGKLTVLYLLCFIWIPMLISWIFGTWGRNSFEYAKASMWSKHSMVTALGYLVLSHWVS